MLKQVREKLLGAGWSVTKEREPIISIKTLDIIARKGDFGLAIMVSGIDATLKHTQVRDFSRQVRLQNLEPVFVHGEQVPSMVILEARDRNAILISSDDLGYIEDHLSILPVSGRGWIEALWLSGWASGWARLTPTTDKADVLAFHEDERIGATIANIYRDDMKNIGDGCFGFKIQLPSMTAEEFLGKVKLVIYHRGRPVRGLRIIEGFRSAG